MEYGPDLPVDTSGAPEEDRFMKPFQIPLPEGCRAYVLDRDELWLKPLSGTFHGRDIFAPVAAHLSAGVEPEEMGRPVDHTVSLYVPQPVERDNAIHGRIIYVDRFGNLVSNIRPGDFAGDSVDVEIEGTSIRGLSRSYAGGEGPLAIVGSHDYLEIAVNEGSAAERLQARVGTSVKLRSVDGVTRS